MVQRSFVAICGWSFVATGCTLPVEDTGIHPDDMKPRDGSELAGARVGSVSQAHALHYTDSSNQWLETGYPMGTDNPNCKDWWVYDQYWNSRPPIGTTKFSTFEVNHPWAKGPYVESMQAAIPDFLGYSSAWKTILIDHNSVTARVSGQCSGRYVFQFDNRDFFASGPFGANSYWISANIPPNLIPANPAACTSKEAVSVPAVMVDLYVCEAPNSASVGAVNLWCKKSSGHWHKVGSAAVSGGSWNAAYKRCDVSAGVYYPRPSGKVAVAFNVVVKAGIGHGVAPADINVVRYD
jgi:hypothetical protein